MEMQWQLSLTLLAQPVFDPDASREKADVIMELVSALSGEGVDQEEEMSDGDAVALLEMAGRRPIRIINAGTGNTSDNT